MEHNVWEKIRKGWKVDKIKFKYTLKQIKDVQAILDKLGDETSVKTSWESKDIKSCRYNYVLEQEDGTFYIGIESNQFKGNTEEKRKTLVLEYNPQKTDPFKLSYINKLKELDLHRRKILYVDLAYDIEVDIKDLEYTKRRKNENWTHIGHDKLETIYLGTKGTNGAVKIYDKVKELNKNLNEDLNQDTGEVTKKKYNGICTRYEISIKPEKDAINFNILNPFLFEKLTKLHELNIKQDNDKIMQELEKYEGNEFTNLLTVHLGKESKLNNRAKKKYKDIYQQIKKSCIPTTEYNNEFKNFNTYKAYICLKNYLDYTSIHKVNAIIESEL